MKLKERFNLKDIEHLGLKNKYIAYYLGSGIGANLVGLQSIGYSYVLCVEPNLLNFKTLEALNKNKNNIICLNVSVSDYKNTTPKKLYTATNIPFSSTLDEKWFTETRNNKFYNPNEIIEEITIMYTIDDLVNMFGKPGYICMDINGHELYALCGMSFKTELLSFPWYGEIINDACSCLLRLDDLGYKEFCITRYNELPEKIDIWVDLDKCIGILSLILSKLAKDYIGGTIFCR